MLDVKSLGSKELNMCVLSLVDVDIIHRLT